MQRPGLQGTCAPTPRPPPSPPIKAHLLPEAAPNSPAKSQCPLLNFTAPCLCCLPQDPALAAFYVTFQV